jgi:two-component system CheB/CheR fusion protein
VRDLLDLSRLHIGKLSLNREVVSLTSLIENAVETVSGEAAQKEIELRIEGAADVIFVNADPLRFEQIIWNLLNNAVKFTPVGGTVTIRLGSESGRARIVVEDTGPGVDPQFLPHVFEMFRQADASSSRPHGGMGIGLALVKQLIELHGGSVAAASTLGRGATFTIELPATAEKDEPAGYSPQEEAGILSNMRILIVDDSADTVEMLRRLFEMDGAVVATASSAPEALEIAGQKDFDAVLSDISMPGMDGFEFVRRLRQLSRHRNVPVLAITGFGRPSDVERAAAEGFFSHVTKPIDVNNLVQMLRELPVKNQQASATTQN